jgi:hypothetical protein
MYAAAFEILLSPWAFFPGTLNGTSVAVSTQRPSLSVDLMILLNSIDDN